MESSLIKVANLLFKSEYVYRHNPDFCSQPLDKCKPISEDNCICTVSDMRSFLIALAEKNPRVFGIIIEFSSLYEHVNNNKLLYNNA